jgi:hypothetical protein
MFVAEIEVGPGMLVGSGGGSWVTMTLVGALCVGALVGKIEEGAVGLGSAAICVRPG